MHSCVVSEVYNFKQYTAKHKARLYAVGNYKCPPG